LAGAEERVRGVRNESERPASKRKNKNARSKKKVPMEIQTDLERGKNRSLGQGFASLA
jgi:hypothetical protein